MCSCIAIYRNTSFRRVVHHPGGRAEASRRERGHTPWLAAAAGRPGGGVLGAVGWAHERAEASGRSGSGPAAVAAGLVTCVLSPEQTEGPFFTENDRIRRDVRDGRPGVPLSLRAGVLDVSTCEPIRGALVDIWHCDAGGTYSGFAQEGTAGARFLRGIQRTDRNGLAIFRTIYPGWYPGRTVHIHVRVYVGGDVVHTGQLYFPDALTDAVFRRVPYSRRPARTTRNPSDALFRNGGSRSLLKLTRNGTGYAARITMGVQLR
jgi:protocatechuate 3,4-dioxygenase beta subunit